MRGVGILVALCVALTVGVGHAAAVEVVVALELTVPIDDCVEPNLPGCQGYIWCVLNHLPIVNEAASEDVEEPITIGFPC